MSASVYRQARAAAAAALEPAASKKFQSHVHALELYFAFCNFCRIHKTLRVTPAMAAGITDKLWTLDDIVALMNARAPKPGSRKPYDMRANYFAFCYQMLADLAIDALVGRVGG